MDMLYLDIQLDRKSILLAINKSKTVKDLYDAVRKKIPGGSNLNFYLWTWMAGNNALDENSSASIESLNLPQRAHLDLCIRMPSHGGIRDLTPLPGFIEVTASPCDFSFDDDPSIDRAKMPCGCVIDPEVLKELCDTSINDGNFGFSCPNCKVSWQLQWVRHVLSAVMTEDEIGDFISKLNDNFIAKQFQIKKCPTCENFLERSLKEKFINWNWVRCPLCTSRSGKNVEFCWICLKPWKGTEKSCGNEGCNGVGPEMQLLQTCEPKTIGKVEGVPSVRGCVNCGNLINHKDNCKHITCRCGYSFCFVCLKPCLKGSGWQCGDAYDRCEVATRQLDFSEIAENISNSSMGGFWGRSKTVKDLHEAVRKKIDAGPDFNFYLAALTDGQAGPTMLDEKSTASIESLKLAKGANLHVCIIAPGGSRELTPLPGYIEVTTSPCNFSLDDDPSIDRAKMPCGCVIDPKALKDLCDTAIKDRNVDFSCPNCKVGWQLQWVRHVLSAVMAENEIGDFISKLNDNFIAKQLQIKKCPTCENFLERSLKEKFINWNWVRCPLCTRRSGQNVEFCWICLKPWKGDEKSCGNEGCTGRDEQMQLLQTCEPKIIGIVHGVPSIRGCVKCGNLINHKDNCKHVKCRCGYSFCFVCLKPFLLDFGWQCGGPYARCPVAPRQVDFSEIPETMSTSSVGSNSSMWRSCVLS